MAWHVSSVSLPVPAPCSGIDGGRWDLRVVTRWRWPAGHLTAPLLSAGEAFLGSFVASGMGPSASSHGSPVPLPSELSFRSPTPSNLPMVQLWAAHAHEGKECARRVGRGLPGRWLSPALLKSAHCPPQSPLALGLVGPSAVTDAVFRGSVLPLVTVTGPLHKPFPLFAAPRPTPLAVSCSSFRAQLTLPASLTCDNGFTCVRLFMKYVFSCQSELRGQGLVYSPHCLPGTQSVL